MLFPSEHEHVLGSARQRLWLGVGVAVQGAEVACDAPRGVPPGDTATCANSGGEGIKGGMVSCWYNVFKELGNTVLMV